MKCSLFKRTATAMGVAAALSAGTLGVSQQANALGFFPGFNTAHKYLVVWMGDQMLDGVNVSPLDAIVFPDGTDGNPPDGVVDGPADLNNLGGVSALPGAMPDADFLAVIDAEPSSPTYGQIVNTAEMPIVLDQHLLSETENFVDNALDIVAGGDGSGTGGGTIPGAGDYTAKFGDILGEVNGILAPSSILNESHHMNVQHVIGADGSRNIYPAGLISANIFGCDITDPLNIKPSAGTTTDLLGRTNNFCGLSISGKDVVNYSGTDDLLPMGGGHLIATYMGAKGTFVPGSITLPPTLTTPGGLVEIDTATNTVVAEYTAIPSAPLPNAGTFADGSPMLGPKRYAPRTQIVLGSVDGNGNPVPGPLAGAGVGLGPDTGAVDLPNGINEGPDTGLLAHPHGVGIRPDLPNPMGGQGIIMASDYADPVSLALTGSGEGPQTSAQNLGTTIRLWDMDNMAAGPYAVVEMPDGPRHEDNQIHEENEGLMAMAMTNRRAHKGAFVASMCGGSIFYSPDVTVQVPEFRNVYDFGACTGASVFTVTRNDRYLIVPLSGIQTDVSPPAAAGGDPVHDRDYAGEHSMRVVALDIKNLLAAGTAHTCNDSSYEMDGVTPAAVSKWSEDPGTLTPLGEPLTLGPSGVLGHPEHTSGPMAAAYSATGYWPNNGSPDCPTIASVVYYDGNGADGIPGTADDHPDAETTRGGPHFVVHDELERYVATSNYFVDLREYAIADTGTLKAALGLLDAYVPGTGFTAAGTTGGNGTPAPGGLGGLLGQTNVLPGTGSVGDDTICMMKLNRWTGSLTLDTSFNAGDNTSPQGCIDPDFGDSGKSWPAAGARAAGAGNATPHAMTFVTKR